MTTSYFVNPQGFYIGAFEGCEPPIDSVEVPNPPPRAPMVWSGSTWIATQADLAAYAADRRWQVENGGIVRNGQMLPTHREGRSALKDARDMLRDGELLDAQGNPLTTMDVTMFGVSVNITEAQATNMLKAIAQHVQACFAVEAQVLAAIQAGTITTYAAVDAADWPSNV